MTKGIIAAIKGGLGNQLFQYSFGRHLSIRNNQALKLDISFYKNQTLRTFLLSHFNVTATIASNADIKPFFPKGLLGKVFRKLFVLKTIREEKFSFHASAIQNHKRMYLEGWWQSERYFKPIDGVLRKELVLLKPLSPSAREWDKKITNCTSVAIHFRRGDYVSNPETASFHGVCDLSYYEKAIKHITQKIPSPRFFVFSDDMPWVINNWKWGSDSEFIKGEIPDEEALILMSHCKHQIIANSSFSWWGAWLNSNKTKTIICPRSWFLNPAMDTSDLIPSDWIKF